MWISGQSRVVTERERAQSAEKRVNTNSHTYIYIYILYICNKWWRSALRVGYIINRFHAILAVIFQQATITNTSITHNTIICVCGLRSKKESMKYTEALQKVKKDMQLSFGFLLAAEWLVI